MIITDEQVQEHYDEFFEEIFVELEDKVTKLLLALPLFHCKTAVNLISI